MEDAIQLFIQELREKNRGDLDLANHDYFLFFQDGLFTLSADEGTEELKIHIELHDVGQAKVFHTEDKIDNYMTCEGKE